MSLNGIASSRTAAPLDTEVVSASLSRAGLRDAARGPLEMDRGWPLAKIPLLVRYSEPAVVGSRPQWWSIYFLGATRVPFSCRSALGKRTAVYLEDLHAVVQEYPADLQLSGVDQAGRGRTALDLVKAALPGNGADWQSLTTRILNYKPSRRLTVRFRLESANGGSRTIFGKLFPPGGDEKALQAQKALGPQQTVGRSDRFSVPPIVGRIRDWNALLWRSVPGRSLFEEFQSADLGAIVLRVARCLAALHQGGARWSRVHDREREMSTVRSWMEAVRRVDPAPRVGLERACANLRETIPKAEAAGLVPSHRDFYDKQILVGERHCTLLDFEVASRAEPELDVANFLAHLELRGLQGRSPRVGVIAQLFIEEYSRTGNRLDRARLRWYLASSLLRLACVFSFRSEWAEVVSILETAATETLAGERFSIGDSLL